MRFTILLLLALTSCAVHPQPVKTQKVNIAVAVPCHQKDVPEPRWSVNSLPPTASYSLKVQAVFEDMAKAKGYIGELQAELSGCK